jgi:hypothetical protein
MEFVVGHRTKELESDPAVVSGVLISRADDILGWGLKLPETRHVMFDVGKDGVPLVG